MVISAIMQGTQFTIEQRYMEIYILDPFEFAGWEGIWGILVCLILLPIFQFIPWDSEICNNGVVEHSINAIDQIFANFVLVVLIWSSITVIWFYNGFGLQVTNLVSATNRVVLRQLKIVLIWIFFLLYPYEGHETFKPLQFVGFLILVFGVFLYNEVIVLRFWGMDQNLLIKDDKSNDEFIELEESL